ncbi:hypothetical protein AXW67_09490 [Bradyrhizobium neotropicale]|uniref:Type I restriction modification DNA specificity domain-containing protein n=2 Tax=Bradyrhizobium neotropicale TaxID=1497615 RepID=A0A176Z9U8_9BRAD|nr:hypothetical protein AXW67_09490 [Bradyrhizobium neotropicale]
MGSAGQNGYHDTAIAKGPGVVIGRSGASYGQAHFCWDDYWPHNTALYVTDFQGNDPKYVFYFLKGFDFRSHNSGGAQQSLNRNFIAPLPVSLPPLPEQQAIAKVLDDADALIDALEAVIAKKRDVKLGAVQEWMSGQRRLPGFRGEWVRHSLRQLGSFAKGAGVKKDQANSGDLPCVRYGELYTHHSDVIRGFNSHISREVAAIAFPLRCGDVLFAGSGETREEIGKCAAFVDDVEAYAGGDIVVLRPSIADPTFLGYLLNTPPVQSQKASKGQGDAVVHISAAALAAVEVDLPPTTHEQRAITAVLLDMDAEIAALEGKLAKARAVKKGMMQVLLTGEARLV